MVSPSPMEVTFDPNADSALTPSERDMRRAVSDPGALVARRWWNTEGGKEYETVLHWQARAVNEVVRNTHSVQREAIVRLEALAEEAYTKGLSLQPIPEMRLVSNAYMGMADRIRTALSGAPRPPEPSGAVSASTDTQSPQNATESAAQEDPVGIGVKIARGEYTVHLTVWDEVVLECDRRGCHWNDTWGVTRTAPTLEDLTKSAEAHEPVHAEEDR